jgi:hypothetical protein
MIHLQAHRLQPWVADVLHLSRRDLRLKMELDLYVLVTILKIGDSFMYRGRMGGYGLGPGGRCVCPRCGYVIPHTAGTPCFQIKCPNCGSPMTRLR